MAFSAPSSNNESVKVADLNGHLLILEALEYKTGIPTVHGDADAIEVRINDLDTGQSHESVLFFNVALKNALKTKIGQKVLFGPIVVVGAILYIVFYKTKQAAGK